MTCTPVPNLTIWEQIEADVMCGLTRIAIQYEIEGVERSELKECMLKAAFSLLME